MSCDKGDREMKCPIQIRRGRLLSQWTKWSVCDDNCQTRGLGIQTRRRICTKPKKCGDKKLHQERDCRSACNPSGQGFRGPASGIIYLEIGLNHHFWQSKRLIQSVASKILDRRKIYPQPICSFLSIFHLSAFLWSLSAFLWCCSVYF